MKKTLSTAFVVAALTFTSACGGDGGDRPSKGEITDQIMKASDGQFKKKQAECVAAAIHDSDLSDEAVSAIADNDEDYKLTGDDKKAEDDITKAMGKCLTD